jgi:hypothetical protein
VISSTQTEVNTVFNEGCTDFRLQAHISRLISMHLLLVWIVRTMYGIERKGAVTVHTVSKDKCWSNDEISTA